jgi:hypothetical protein
MPPSCARIGNKTNCIVKIASLIKKIALPRFVVIVIGTAVICRLQIDEQ